MSKEKQIEEMSVLIYTGRSLQLPYVEIAECLYKEGYRKQSEWISVDERLPPESKNPILVTNGEKVIVAYRNWLYRSGSTGKLRCPANYGNGMHITHWMPLPEAPKMKGGAE